MLHVLSIWSIKHVNQDTTSPYFVGSWSVLLSFSWLMMLICLVRTDWIIYIYMYSNEVQGKNQEDLWHYHIASGEGHYYLHCNFMFVLRQVENTWQVLNQMFLHYVQESPQLQITQFSYCLRSESLILQIRRFRLILL
jgi:hypothetical protein